MTVKEIVYKYLKENGYDGLYSEVCGCNLSELFVCGFDEIKTCKAGYFTDGSYGLCDPDCTYYIGSKK